MNRTDLATGHRSQRPVGAAPASHGHLNALRDIRPVTPGPAGPSPVAGRAVNVWVAGMLGLAAACWFVAVHQMNGMDMGVATRLGSWASFVVLWVTMMAAMMLPGAVPAVLRRARAIGRARTAPIFVCAYLAVWTLAGVAVYAVYRPHGSVAAGVVVIAAGLYELTPLKAHFRQRCRKGAESGVTFGISCVGSSIGLMLILVAISVMSVTWMAVIAVLVLTQKLLPAKAVIDVPLALALVGLGVLIVIEPSLVPGLTPPM